MKANSGPLAEKDKKLLGVSLNIRKQLNSDSRHFKWDDDVKNSWEKNYNRLERDVKLLRFAEDTMGAISDCFLLYAVACLGVADTDSVRMFLRAMRDNSAGVTIMDIDNLDYVRERMKALVHLGFLFRFNYTVYAHDTKGKLNENGIKLFTIEPEGQNFMNQKLAKRTVVQDWYQAKPQYEIIGWAASSYVQGRIANSGRYIEAKQGLFATKAIGQVFIPGILRMGVGKGDDVADIGFLSAFLYKGEGIMTENDYKRRCAYLVNVIKQFFYNRDSKKHIARMVIVVENNADLVEMATWIEKVGNLTEDYDRIYFTGEGAMRYVADIRGAFLQMRKTDTKTKDIPFVPVVPDFL